MTNQQSSTPLLEVDDGRHPHGYLSSVTRHLTSWRTAGIFIPFLTLFVVLSIASQPFLHTTNLLNILDQQASTLVIAAAGTLVLVSGGIDLSVGATYGLASVIAGQMAETHSPWVAIGVGLIVGLGIGLINGLIVAIFKINALVTTLAMSFVISGVATKVTSGNLIVLTSRAGFARFSNSTFLGVQSAVWWMVIVVVILALLLSRTTYGRYIVASGGNAEAARLAGVRVNMVRIGAYVLSGGAAGLAGIIDTSRVLSAEASAGGSALAFTVLAGIVVGGTSISGGEGSVWRTTIGVLFIALIGNGFDLLGIDPLYQQIVLGVILLIAVGLDVWARQRGR
ncbi:MAG TPA: ABC transporter permease [Acidimicrobiales bacterium]